MTAPSLADGLSAVLTPAGAAPAVVQGVSRLSGGASQETWAFEAVTAAGVQPLILRRAPPGAELRGNGNPGLASEAELIRRAGAAGVPVPGIGFITLYSDITEQKRAERQALEHAAELEPELRRLDDGEEDGLLGAGEQLGVSRQRRERHLHDALGREVLGQDGLDARELPLEHRLERAHLLGARADDCGGRLRGGHGVHFSFLG